MNDLGDRIDQRRKYTKEKLTEMAKTLNIPLKKRTPKVIEGWAGKPKGLFQELRELGWLEPDGGKFPSPRTRSRYTKEGKKEDFDVNGNLKEDAKKFSLCHLRGELSDFKNEKSEIGHLLEEISARIGVRITCKFSPKYHCELAGEGIEYSWGLVKRRFRSLPLTKRDKAHKFIAAAQGMFQGMDVDSVRMFSRRARSYMLVYLGNGTTALTQTEIERQRHVFRSHRDAGKFVSGFIEKVLRQLLAQLEVSLAKK